MRCERCDANLGSRLLCRPCGSSDLDTRLAFRAGLLRTLSGWGEAGWLNGAVTESLTGRVRAEQRALARLAGLDGAAQPDPAPASPPVPKASPIEEPATAAPEPLPLPTLPQPEATEDGGVRTWLRARVGWITGVLLTVVGSIYLAGSIWSDLPPLWQHALVWAWLAVAAWGFGRVGRRLAQHPGGELASRWLHGVAVALVPVHALAVGGLWQLDGIGAIAGAVGLAATGLLHGRLLRRSLPGAAPGLSPRFRTAWLALALSVGLVPLVGGPGWLVLPALLALVGLRVAVTGGTTRGWLPALLVAEPLLFCALFTPQGPVGAYGPVLVLAALGVLYLDAARARWRRLHRARPSGPLGVLSLALAAGALVALGTTLAPLPTTASSLAAALLLVGFFAAATASWRRPIVFQGALVAGLLVMLALPAQFALAVQWLAAQAGQALGYTEEPLPLAWYSLTLLPYLAGVRWLEGALRRSGWRQPDALARQALAFGATCSGLLMLAAHSRPDDLRPALLALPLHAGLWAWRRPLRHRPAAAVLAVIGAVWIADGLGLLGLSGSASLAWLGGLGLVAAWTARSWLPHGARAEGPLACAGLLAGIVGLGAQAAGWSTAAWAVGAGSLALVGAAGAWASARWTPDRRVPTLVLSLTAHLLAGAAVAISLELGGFARSLAKLPVAVALVGWLVQHRHPAYGAVLAAGLGEALWRQAPLLGATDPALRVALAATLAGAPALAWLAGWRPAAWLQRAWVRPAAWVGGALAAVSLFLCTALAFPTAAHVAVPAVLAGLALFSATRLPALPTGQLARGFGLWTVAGTFAWLGVPAEVQAWAFGFGAAALVARRQEQPWALGLVLLSLGAGALALVTGPITPSMALLALGLGWLGFVWTTEPVSAWAGLVAAVALALVPGGADPYAALAGTLAAAALLGLGSRLGQDRAVPLALVAGAFGAVLIELALNGEPLLVAVLGLHAVGLVLARLRGRDTAPVPWSGWTAVPLWAAAVLAAPAFDEPMLGAAAALTVGAALGRRKVLLTLWVPLLVGLVLHHTAGLEGPEPLAVAWVLVGLALRRRLPGLTVLTLLLAAFVDGLDDQVLQPLVLLAPLGAMAWELRLGWQRDEGWRWWPALAWLGWGIVAARWMGPLQGLPETWLVPVSVALAVGLEVLHAAVVPLKGEAFVRPVHTCARALPLVVLSLALPLGGLSAWGVGLVGALALLRYVFRPRTSDLLLGVVLLDASALWAFAESGVTDPVVWVAPVSLSLLLVARQLRDALGPQVVAGFRYLAAGALYLAAFGDLLGSPGGSLVMLLLGLVGIAAGTWFRVRAYLHLGAGVAVATLVADALRFGLAHSEFWALYLALLGLAILGAMVAGTLHRDRLGQWRLALRTAMAGWD